MKIKNAVLRTCYFSLIALLLISWKSNEQLKLNQAFEIYGNVVKEILNNYIYDVDIDTLLEKSIEGMLGTLDPYTEYFNEELSNRIEFLLDGSYVGFGFTVMPIDSMLTIVRLQDDSPAYNAGLRIGDIIYSIDGTIVVNRDEIRQFTHQLQKGTVSNFVIMRKKNITIYENSDYPAAGLSNSELVRIDTLRFLLKRDVINLPSIIIAKLIDEDIAYIKVERFSKKTADLFYSEFLRLKAESGNSLSGLIIDVRDNSGGILAEVVNMCELFVPRGSKIVSTRGKDGKYINDYISNKDPIDIKLPIAVLINENSASASEILAGAIQDLDRGVILGNTSFGKGLVQTIVELSDKTAMKLTTAKYYTPSGRCLQKINHQNKNDTAKETSNVFYTQNGRKVFETNGITPDIEIDKEKTEKLISEFSKNMIFFHFANLFCAKNEFMKFSYEMNKQVYNSFVEFATSKEVLKKNKDIKYLLDLKAGLSESTNDIIDSLFISMQNDFRNMLINDENIKKQAKSILDFEIKSRFYKEKIVSEDLLDKDQLIIKSKEILSSNLYRTMLTNSNN
ncbi:MAG: PDZ domain-containing protein [Ignavibacteria bacterium]|jgi:carboxyl-terminal processing protease|nr:PDZ domain-containing protein [Ignavibacteria bacterium]